MYNFNLLKYLIHIYQVGQLNFRTTFKKLFYNFIMSLLTSCNKRCPAILKISKYQINNFISRRVLNYKGFLNFFLITIIIYCNNADLKSLHKDVTPWRLAHLILNIDLDIPFQQLMNNFYISLFCCNNQGSLAILWEKNKSSETYTR